MAIDEDANDFSYFSVMRFGASQTPMYMLIDTGSANTWVFDENCPSASCKEHNTFGSGDSTTLQVTTTPFSLAYGTGQVTGIVGSDTVSFANYTTDLGFGLATTASSDFNFYPMDGILGLGPTSSNSLGVPTVMEHLDSADLLPHGNIIGIHLQRQTDNTHDGQITFGSIDTTRYTGNLNYISTSPGSDMWEIPVTDALVDGSACAFTGRSAVIDTGTSYILMPFQDALTLHDLIPGTAHAGEDFTIPCDATAEVQFTFGGVTYSVGPQDYLGKPSGSDTSLCNSNIIGHQAFGPDQWILGDVFLKNVYAVFDFDRNKIGKFCLPRTNLFLSESTGSYFTPNSLTHPLSQVSALNPAPPQPRPPPHPHLPQPHPHPPRHPSPPRNRHQPSTATLHSSPAPPAPALIPRHLHSLLPQARIQAQVRTSSRRPRQRRRTAVRSGTRVQTLAQEQHWLEIICWDDVH